MKWNYYKQNFEEGNFFLSKLLILHWTRKMPTQAEKQNKFLNFKGAVNLLMKVIFVCATKIGESRATDQSILHVFLLCLKSNDPQTFKSGSSKIPSLQCGSYWSNLFRWMLFILCDNWSTLHFITVYLYSEIVLTSMLFFFKSQWFEGSGYFMHYLHSNSTILLAKFQGKADYAS